MGFPPQITRLIHLSSACKENLKDFKRRSLYAFVLPGGSVQHVQKRIKFERTGLCTCGVCRCCCGSHQRAGGRRHSDYLSDIAGSWRSADYGECDEHRGPLPGIYRGNPGTAQRSARAETALLDVPWRECIGRSGRQHPASAHRRTDLHGTGAVSHIVRFMPARGSGIHSGVAGAPFR